MSPLLGALYLKALDDRLSTRGLFYVRYMDDILVLTRSHGQLRRAVRTLNQTFDELKLAQAPDKTFIGRIARGFDFLGYHFSRATLALAPRTLEKHAARWHLLYEQQKRKTAPEGAGVLDAYALRWRRWCRAGLGGLLGAKFIRIRRRRCDQPSKTPAKPINARDVGSGTGSGTFVDLAQTAHTRSSKLLEFPLLA